MCLLVTGDGLCQVPRIRCRSRSVQSCACSTTLRATRLLDAEQLDSTRAEGSASSQCPTGQEARGEDDESNWHRTTETRRLTQAAASTSQAGEAAKPDRSRNAALSKFYERSSLTTTSNTHEQIATIH